MRPICTVLSNFSHNIPSMQLLLFAVMICLLWFAECLFVSFPIGEKISHTGPNLMFILTAAPLQMGLSVLVVATSQWTFIHHWGILYIMPYPKSIFVKYIIGFVLLDLMDYVYHVVMHKMHLLWKFHQVHHTDGNVDVSTTLREHPGETIIRLGFLCLWIILIGAGLGPLILRQTIQSISNIMAHTQLRFPKRIEKILSLVFITPHLHSIHHHDSLPYTDSNYGDVLSIWDRVFGTYRQMDREKINHGLDIVSPEKSRNFIDMIKIPFSQSK